jgi:hypothetical protein
MFLGVRKSHLVPMREHGNFLFPPPFRRGLGGGGQLFVFIQIKVV